MNSVRAAALWAVAAVAYLALEAAAAAGYHPGYSYARNYISDLGLPSGTLVRGQVIDSPRAQLMHAAFCLQGALFFLGALLMVGGRPGRGRGRTFLAAAGANAIGNVVIATVHSGPAHVVGAVLAIAGGNAAIALGSAVIQMPGGRRYYGRVSTCLAALGLSCLAVLAITSGTGSNPLPDGVWERGSVYSITLWQLLTGAWLLIARRASRAAARSGPRERPGSRR